MIDCFIPNLYHNDRKFYHHDRILIEFVAAFPISRPPCTVEPFPFPDGTKGQAKSKSKAKAEPAAKKQKTCAASAEEEAAMVQWQAHGAMGAVLFHKKATKMRNLLQYRFSDLCKKAYIYMYTYHVSS